MTVYEKVRQLQLGVFVIVTKPFAKEEVRFYSHEVDKLRESERFNGFMNLNVKAVRNIPALLQVEIIADEPGCKVFDYEYRITGDQRSNNIHNINANNKIAEFACRVCHKKMKKANPSCITCAWRGIDGEYCPELLEALEEFQHENRN